MSPEVIVQAVAFSGGLFAMRFAFRLSLMMSVTLAFPFGLGLGAYGAMLASTLVPALPEYLAAALTLAACNLVRFFPDRPSLPDSSSRALLIPAILVFIFLAVPLVLDKAGVAQYIAFTSDSFSNYEGLGRVLGLKDGLTGDPTFVLRIIFEPLLPFLHAIGFSAGINHFVLIYPVLAVLTPVVTFLFINDLSIRWHWSVPVLLLVTVLLFASTYYVLMSLHVLPNVIAGLFFLVTCFLFMYHQRRRAKVGDGLSAEAKSILLVMAIFLALSATVRTEFKILNLVLIFLLSVDRAVLKKVLIVYIPLAYYWDAARLLLFQKIIFNSEQAAFLTNVITLNAASLASIFLIYVSAPIVWATFTLVRLVQLTFGLSVLALLLTWLIAPESLTGVISNLTGQLLTQDMWGLTWFVVCPAILIAFYLDNDDARRHSISLILMVLLMFRVLAYVALPGLLSDDSFMSSGNRTMLHFLPLAIFYPLSVISGLVGAHHR